MLIDTHCHLTDEKLINNLDSILLDAQKNDVQKIITLGTNINDSNKAIEVSEKYPAVYSCVGIYPHEEKDTEVKILKTQLIELLNKSKKIIGIGECGIDTPKGQILTPLHRQEELFKMQIDTAIESSLPVVIHNRDANDIVLEILKTYRNAHLTGVVHSFVSNWDFAEQILNLGLYLSFNAIITYPSGKDILDVVKKVPLDKILVETDAPYLPPQGLRDKINEPKYVRITTKTLSDVRNIDFEEMANILAQNSQSLFSKMNA